MQNEFTCKACGHNFNKLVSSEDSDTQCPRCGGHELERNRYLLGSPNTDDLTLDDYCDVALAPCCTPDWKGWRNVFYSTGTWQPEPESISDQPEKKEEEKQAER